MVTANKAKTKYGGKMKRIVIFILLVMIMCSIIANEENDIVGQWSGVLNVQGMNMRLVFHIDKSDESYTATMDSPDQGAFGIPVATTTYENSTLTLEIPSIGLFYEADLLEDTIVGTFKQGGLSLPLTLERTFTEATPFNRPQEPIPPFPYRSEDVTFENREAGVTLSGTLTMPTRGRNFRAVILISGSGPQDRNEEVFGHKPFLVLADHLTRQGIAVLRFDDRGVGLSTGDHATATTADFATDVESAIDYLKTRREINNRNIGLIGHSEGGIIAPMVASRSNDVAFVVMLAGTGMRGAILMLKQAELILQASGMSEDFIRNNMLINAQAFAIIVSQEEPVPSELINAYLLEIKDDIEQVLAPGMSVEDHIELLVTQLSTPWMQYFLRYDPAPTLELVKCPVFALNGENDLQVPARENLSIIQSALERGGNKRVTIKEYPGLNHLFQECETGLPANYVMIEQTISPEVLKDIADWIRGL